jgi:hypothetical protein
MSTYALINPTAADLDLKLKVIGSTDRGLFVLVNSQDTPQQSSARYLYNGGSTADRLVLEVTKRFDSRQNKTVNTIRLTTKIRETDAEGAITDQPVEFLLGWNYEGRSCASPDTIVLGLELLFGIPFFELAAANGFPKTDSVSSIERGVLTTLFD